jgi:hypothetical protein
MSQYLVLDYHLMFLSPFTEDAIDVWTEPKYYNILHPMTQSIRNKSVYKKKHKIQKLFISFHLKLRNWKYKNQHMHYIVHMLVFKLLICYHDARWI